MSETDDTFWDEIWDNYVEGYVNEDFPEDDEEGFKIRQGLVADEGEARRELHNTLFNKIVQANKGGVYDKIPFFKNARNHGLVRNSDKLAKIAQTKLEDSVGREEKRRLEKAVKARRTVKGTQQAIQAVKVVTSAGRREEETAKASAFRREGDLASSFIATIRREAGQPSDIDAIVRQAQNEISGKQLERVQRAAKMVKQFGVAGEV